MFSSDQLNSLLKEIMSQMGVPGETATAKSSGQRDGGKENKNLTLKPAELLTIAGLIGGVFKVSSILISSEQLIQIRIDGSLKRKTDLERTMDKIGSHSFDEVVKALLGRMK